MNIKETENAFGFEVLQGGEVICLSNAGGYIEIDREQLVELMAVVKPWAECGEMIR